MNFSTNNSSFNVSKHDDLYFYYNICSYYFCVVGLIAVGSNVGLALLTWRLNLIASADKSSVTSTTDDDRSRSNRILTFGYAIGEVIMCAGYVCNGVYVRQVGYDFGTRITAYDCMIQPHVLFQFLGRHICAWSLLGLGTERLLIAFAQKWYKAHCSSTQTLIYTIAVASTGVILTAYCIHFASTVTKPALPPYPIFCTVVFVHVALSRYLYTVNGLGSLISSVFTIAALLKTYLKRLIRVESVKNRVMAIKCQENKHAQWRGSKAIAAVISVKFVLFVLPNIALLLLAFNWRVIASVVTIAAPVAQMTILMNSASNGVSYMIFKQQY